MRLGFFFSLCLAFFLALRAQPGQVLTVPTFHEVDIKTGNGGKFYEDTFRFPPRERRSSGRRLCWR